MHANGGVDLCSWISTEQLDVYNSKVDWTEEQLDFDLLGDEKRGSKIDMDSLFVGSYEGGLMSTSDHGKTKKLAKL